MEWIASSCHRATWSICLIAENTENAIETCTVKNLLDPPNILWWITQLNVLAGYSRKQYSQYITTRFLLIFYSFVFNRFMREKKECKKWFAAKGSYIDDFIYIMNATGSTRRFSVCVFVNLWICYAFVEIRLFQCHWISVPCCMCVYVDQSSGDTLHTSVFSIRFEKGYSSRLFGRQLVCVFPKCFIAFICKCYIHHI